MSSKRLLLLALLAPLACKEPKLPDPPPGMTSVETMNGKVGFKLGIQASCTYGRANLIAADRKGDRPPKLLLSLERMTKGGKVYASKEVTLAKLRKGVILPFNQSAVKGRVPLGFFLCSNGAGEKSCQGKKLVDLGEMALKLGLKKGKGGTDGLPIGADKVYYQQTFLSALGRVYYIEPEIQHKQFDGVHAFLKGAIDDDRITGRLVQYMTKVHTDVAFPIARPARTKGGVPYLGVVLDELNEAKCEKIFEAKVDASESLKSAKRAVIVRPPPAKRQPVKPPPD